MKKFDIFYFEKFDFDKILLTATFYYSFDGIQLFEEKINFFSDSFFIQKKLKDNVLNNILFNIHIAIGISYYKLFPTKKLIIKSGFLSLDQIIFWKKFYLNGLGEFFVTNNFDFKNILNFENINSSKNHSCNFEIDGNKSLLMWGGGKDSIVSSLLLEEQGSNFVPFIFGKIDRVKNNTLKILGKTPMLVTREISDSLFTLNKMGYYNGHIPITGIIAFVSILSSYLYNFKNIILSNEKSADEGNITWSGLSVNHQYSKSGEFENDFNEYVLYNISSDLSYYSKLRDKYEIDIAKIFAEKGKKYFYSFSSCNRNFKISGKIISGNWCNNCEKCAFVYLILSPFLNEQEIVSIFGENLLDKESLLNVYEGLLGLSDKKPFECVGTYDECLESFKLNIYNYKNGFNSSYKFPIVLKLLETKIN